MTEQLSLMSLPAVGAHRRHGVRSEIEAAASCDSQRQRDMLLRELRAALEGRTCDELETATQIPRYIVASRLAQMKRDFLCAPFGFRENARGRLVQLWFYTPTPRQVDQPTGSYL